MRLVYASVSISSDKKTKAFYDWATTGFPVTNNFFASADRP